MLLRTAHNQFIRECQDGTLQRYSLATLANYKSSMSLFLKLVPVTDTRDLTEAVLRRFIRIGEDERAWKSDTHITHRKNLRVFAEWCINKRYLTIDPFINIPYPPTPRRLPKFYTEEELKRILYAVDKYADNELIRLRNRTMFAALILSGIRKGELLGLRAKDFDFDTQFLNIGYRHAKNRADRVIPMVPELMDEVQKYIKLRDAKYPDFFGFWISSHGEEFTEHGWKHLVSQLAEKVGFNISAHKIRHTFATNFCRDGGDVRELQQILGHRDITTTMIYAHTMPEDLRGAMLGHRLNDLF